MPILRQWRPELKISVVDAPPSGLVLVTNLDPENHVLQDNYHAIVDTYLGYDLGVYGVKRLHHEANIASTEKFASAGDFGKFRAGKG